MLQEFQVKNIKETLESNDELYQIMNYRMTYFSKESNSKNYYEILKIPDLCYLVKEIQSKNILNILSKAKKPIISGLYHYVFGLNTSNVGLISAYITKYIQKKHNQINYRITQSIFCIFDFFFEKDLRILIKFPGGVKKIYYIDDIEATEVQGDGLKTAFLSSILRIWSFNQSNVPQNAIFMEEINNAETFNYLCESIEWLILNQEKTRIFNNKKVIYLIKYFLKFLVSTRRFTFAISFFNKLLDYNLAYAKYAIEPLKILNLYNDSMTYLSKLCIFPDTEDKNSSIYKNLNKNNVNIKSYNKLLWLEIDILAKLKQYEDALKIAKYVTSMTPRNIDAWLDLAELYLKMKQYENFFKALNNIFIVEHSNNNYNLNLNNENEERDEINLFGFNSNLYSTKKKSYSVNEIPVSFGNQKLFNFNQNMFNSENKYEKKLIEFLGLKANDLFSKQKYCIDIFYSANKYDQFNNIFVNIHDETDDFFGKITLKILNSNYVSFSNIQKKIYALLLTLIKEINFEPFISLKRKIFLSIFSNPSNNTNSQFSSYEKNSLNINEFLSRNENSSLTSNFTQIQSYSLVNEMKILIHPNLELIIDTLIEDLKIFSLIMNSNIIETEFGYQTNDINNMQSNDNNQNSVDKNDIKNENVLNMLKRKNELSIKEIKFCLSFALLNERLGYKTTALNLYTKIQENCFSRFLIMKKINIFLEEKNFKQAIITLGELLSFIREEEFKYVNKTPLWIDDLILKALFEFQLNEIMNWLDDCEEYIWEFIKKIVNKYKYWINIGHDIYLVK